MTDEQLEEAVTVFGRASRLMDSVRLRVWEERGLTLPQLRILFRIREQPGIGVRELAQVFEVTAGSISQQVEKLVGRGLVERSERPEDRRQVSHLLTAAGESAASEISYTGREYMGAILARLTAREREQLTRLLERVIEVAAEGKVP